MACFEDFLQRGAEAGEFVAGEASGVAAGADAGVVEGLVGVDVADAVEEGLVEERGLDGGLAVAEEGDEVFERDGEGFAAGAGVRVPWRRRAGRSGGGRRSGVLCPRSG